MARIMLVDDDSSFLRVYSRILQREGYDIETADSGESAIEILKRSYIDLIVSDVVMPGMGGIELLREIKQTDGDIQIIMLSGKGTIKDAVKAMRLGAYNYLLKPVDIEELLINIERAINLKRVSAENYSYKSEMEEQFKDNRIIGISSHITEVKKRIKVIAPLNSTVLITGETGTGKEIVAKEIHYSSQRRNKPLIKVSCAALAETVLESELFGHEKGAFTGAYKTKKGKFELAHEGTLFLDEIGDLPESVQVKILRVLQEKEFERVGGTKTIKADFRLIAATNRDLHKDVETGRFRKDLYYRLNVIPISLKPLRERKEDVIPLAEYFLGKFAKDLNKDIKGISKTARAIFTNYEWPGNVRELRNIIERCAVFAKGELILPEDIPEEIRGARVSGAAVKPLKQALVEYEKQYILNILEKNEWNIKQTAQEIGIARKNLYVKISKYDIMRPKRHVT